METATENGFLAIALFLVWKLIVGALYLYMCYRLPGPNLSNEDENETTLNDIPLGTMSDESPMAATGMIE